MRLLKIVIFVTFINLNKDLFTSASVGAFIGNLFVPGLGGILLGGLAGAATNELSKQNERQRKKRVFVSFDFHNDRSLKHFIVGQALLPGSPFELVDNSLLEAAPEPEWEERARALIRRSDMVLVLVGSQTYRAPGVLKEVQIANEEGIWVVQMVGYKAGRYRPVCSSPLVSRQFMQLI